jgi:phosphoribosylformylglycinamidine synthase I
VKPRVLVLRAAGINCDVETAHAFERYGAATVAVHVNELLAGRKKLDDYDVLAIPGGFSYGDDIAAGKVLALELLRLRDPLLALVERGGLILGICNGYQVLVKTGLLPGVAAPIGVQEVTLTDNDSNRYEDRWVHLVAESKHSIFVKPGERLHVPLAHGEGKFVPRDAALLATLEARDQIAFRYVAADGGTARYPDNPNGSIGNVAGLVDRTGRVLGLMPHPERAMFAVHHPDWTARPLPIGEEGDGARIFANAVAYLKG